MVFLGHSENKCNSLQYRYMRTVARWVPLAVPVFRITTGETFSPVDQK